MNDFTRAVQRGKVQIAKDGFFIPMTGNSGMVELIVKGSFTRPFNDYSRRMKIEWMEGMLKGLKSVLANSLERYSLSRSNKNRDIVTGGFENKGIGGNSALQDVGCLCVALLQRRSSEWQVARCDYYDDSVAASSDWIRRPESARLSRIAEYPTGAGLVVDSDELGHLFPRLQDENYAAYIRPIHKGHALVLFLFDEKQSRSIDGATQKNLGIVASRMTAA